MYRWVCVAPWQTQGHWVSGTQTLPLSGRVREQTARQRGQTSGCYWEAGVVLQHHWGWFTLLLKPFCALKVPCIVCLNETAVSLDYWAAASTFLCLSIAWIFNKYIALNYVNLGMTFSSGPVFCATCITFPHSDEYVILVKQRYML